MRYLLCFLLVCIFLVSSAQKVYHLQVNTKENSNVLKSLNYTRSFSDSLAVFKEAEKIIQQLQIKGYVAAEIESLNFLDNDVNLSINLGSAYSWVKLHAGNLTPELRNSIGFKENSFDAKTFDVELLVSLFKAIISYYEDSGYPFVSVGLINVLVGDKGVEATIDVKLNQRMVYGAIVIVGSAQVGQKYLQSYLNVKEGYPYIESNIKKVESKLREISFLTVAKSIQVAFTNNKAVLTVYVNKKNANQFDGILGLQQQGSNAKLQVVGNLKLYLQNTLKLGEKLSFDYQGLPNSSKLLDVKASVPHVLNTAFGLAPSLYMYKQDTSFLNVNAKFGVNYTFSGNNNLQLFFENRATTLLATTAYQNSTTLPNSLDAKNTFYGLSAALDRLDYRFNPTGGFSLNAEIAVGSKKISKNSGIDPLLYNGLALSSTTYRFFAQANYYHQIAERLIFALSNQTAFLTGKQLLENEVFRLGGQQSLRGFNELSIQASSYSYGNAELRYLLAQHSFLFAFYNQAVLKLKTDKVNYTDFPLGFGTGVNFETELGIVSVSYALGKQRNIPLNLQQGKIHFGITALF